jgi:hypothetical protein
VTASKPFRLAIHVGPHKTGSTTVQRAVAAARETLADLGVWYPPSVSGAAWPDQHADAWILLRDGRYDEFDRWLSESRAEADRRGCDTLLLSSENFHVPRTRRPLVAAMNRHRHSSGGDVRYVFVRRDIVDLARSRALSHISGETGFYFFHHYDLRRWACDYCIVQERNEKWFARRDTRFVGLADGPRETLAARVLEAAADRPFPGIVSADVNVTSEKLADADAILGYGLRVMHHYASGEAVNVPATFTAARRVLGKTAVDEAAFETLTEGFRAGVTREVTLGIGDFSRLGPVAKWWRSRFASDTRRRQRRD